MLIKHEASPHLYFQKKLIQTKNLIKKIKDIIFRIRI